MVQAAGACAIVMDFTHDISKEKFKLGTIALVCHHWDSKKKKNSQTVIPFGYLLADLERNEGYDILFDFVKTAIQNITGFADFMDAVQHAYVNGFCSNEMILKYYYKNAEIHRCLAHECRNIRKNFGSGLAGYFIRAVDVTAFIHSDFMFDAVFLFLR